MTDNNKPLKKKPTYITSIVQKLFVTAFFVKVRI